MLRDNAISFVNVFNGTSVVIGTQNGGFAVINEDNWRIFYTGNAPLPSNSIVDMVIKQSGIMWIGTAENGIVKQNNNQWTSYTELNSNLISDQVQAIAVDSDMKKWIGTASGLVSYNEISVTEVIVSPHYIAMPEGESFQLEAEVIPENATNHAVFWLSLNDNIATVNDTGYVTTHMSGEVLIQALSPDGQRSGFCTVNVTGTVANPSFNPPGGKYGEILYVEIKSETNNVQIYYTLDGSDPDSLNSLLYEEYVRVETSTTIKAKAYKKDWIPSDITTAVYEIETSTWEDEQLPVVYDSIVFPNPFIISNISSSSDRITIGYDAQIDEKVRIVIYDIRGKKLREFEKRASGQGENRVSFEIDNLDKEKFSSGIYFYVVSREISGKISRGKFSIIR